MKVLKIIFLLALICGLSFVVFKETTLVDQSANEFTSSYYDDYHSQLTTFFLHHPLFEKVKKSPHLETLISAVKQPFENAREARLYHENFVRQLRKAIQSSSSQRNRKSAKTERFFLKELIHWIFYQADLKPGTIQYFYDGVSPRMDAQSSYDSILQILRLNPQFSGLKHHKYPGENQYFHGNLPFLLFTLSNASSTKVFRMGYPLDSINHYRLPWITPKPYPEFKLFVETQSHLYVNLMKREGTESFATSALEQLENTYPNLSVVSLDKNSNFYLQKQDFKPLDAGYFKQKYWERLIDPTGNYYWSHSLNSEDWKKELMQILDKTHQNYFSNAPLLDRNERLDFIELSYLSILDRLAELLQPASMNISCRQCMDRGPSLYVLWMLKKNLVNQAEAKALLFAPPLLIHNRASHTSKIERFISAANRL